MRRLLHEFEGVRHACLPALDLLSHGIARFSMGPLDRWGRLVERLEATDEPPWPAVLDAMREFWKREALAWRRTRPAGGKVVL